MIQILGKLHLLILHLPIGILLLGVLLEWIRLWRKEQVSRNTLTLIYFIGTLATLFACISGYILSRSGDYNLEKVSLHQWAGILTFGLSTGIFLLSLKNYQKIQWSVIPLALFVGITGHLGGNLTHGEGFLWNNEKIEDLTLNIENTDNPLVYEEVIQPILDYKCVSCHGENKAKGKLKLHNREQFTIPGKSGEIILPEANDNGILYDRINLPSDDEDHMPPDHKRQLSEHELSLINWWIENGANFERRILDFEDGEMMKDKLVQLVASSGSEGVANIPAYLPKEELPPVDPLLINTLMEKNVVVLPAGNESAFLEVNFVNVKEIDTEIKQILKQVAPHIVRLKLSDINVDNETLEIIADMKNLIRLYLDESGMTNESLNHLKDMPELRYLNLNGNDIDEDGIQVLANNKQLEEIFAYHTKIENDLEMNNINVVTGDYTLPLLETDTVRIPQ